MFLNRIRCCYQLNRKCRNIFPIAVNTPGAVIKRWNCDNNNIFKGKF